MPNREKPQSSADPKVLEALAFLENIYWKLHTDSQRNTSTGHWINEAFIVRLYAVLNAHRVIIDKEGFDKSLPHWENVKFCKRLRNEIAHATGRVADKDARKLDKEMRCFFDLGEQESIIKGRFILSKDTVLRPMLEGCRKYCKAILERKTATPGAPDL
jgi:hypothetical protein